MCAFFSASTRATTKIQIDVTYAYWIFNFAYALLDDLFRFEREMHAKFYALHINFRGSAYVNIMNGSSVQFKIKLSLVESIIHWRTHKYSAYFIFHMYAYWNWLRVRFAESVHGRRTFRATPRCEGGMYCNLFILFAKTVWIHYSIAWWILKTNIITSTK